MPDETVVVRHDLLLDGVDLAMRYRLPTASEFTSFADAGALMSYGPDQIDMWRRAGMDPMIT